MTYNDLLSFLDSIDYINNDYEYYLKFENGDEFIVSYFGEGSNDVNPITGEDEDDYYSYSFLVKEVICDTTKTYPLDSIIDISKFNLPILFKVR